MIRSDPVPPTVTGAEPLRELCARLRQGEFVALDTEFIRERTYYPVLCLIQVANDEELACIDPLAIDDLQPLYELLSDPSVVKVLHAARQDVEILYHLQGCLPVPLFDTQIAASLTGHGEQSGYGQLVAALLGVELDKAHARTNWAKRPLDAAQLRYAADDVRYLTAVYHLLRAELEQRDRLDCVMDESAKLLDPALYASNPGEAWRRVKGTRGLSSAEQQSLQTLAAWRERQAVRSDRPRGWILRDDALINLVRAAPLSRSALERVSGVPPAVVRKHADRILSLLAQSGESASAAPDLPSERLEPDQKALVTRLLALVRQRASKQDISPSLLATRRDIIRLVLGERNLPLLEGWRLEVAGAEVLQLAETAGGQA